MNTFSLAGCVILYHPDAEVIDNIKSYIDCLDRLYVVDNGGGEEVCSKLASCYPQVSVIANTENMGIAQPLNQVLKLCDGKYSLLMSMDQDSRFSFGSMERYRESLRSFDWGNVLLVGPRIVERGLKELDGTGVRFEEVPLIITSGSIYDVNKAVAIGGFDEKLFIDEVDHEFCYRGRKKGLKIMRCTQGADLLHSIGNGYDSSFLGFRTYTMNHGYIRKYYMARNIPYIWVRYHSLDESRFFRMYPVRLCGLFFHILADEEDKLRRLKYACLGIMDFLRGRMGKRF